MRDVLDAVKADTTAADERRAKMRADYPEFAVVMDSLKGEGRMRSIHVDGELVAGRERDPDPDSWVWVSADFVIAMCEHGRKRK